MKKLLLCATIAVAMCFASCEGFDASDILDRLDNLEKQLEDLENNEENNQGGDNSGDNGGEENPDNPSGGDSGNEDSADNNKIYYTTSDNTKLFPKTDASLYGAILISNTYKDGQGILVFDDVVTSIGYHAFYGCTSLTSITIPESVTSIGESAFTDCTSLKSVYISDLLAWCKIDFYNIGASPLRNGAKLYLNGSELTDITIPSDITEIKSYAFYGCTSLTSVTIPDSVTSIGYQAFENCTSLTSVTIPDSVTSIGESAFKNCTGELIINSKIIETDYTYSNSSYRGWLYGAKFTKLTIGDSITKIGDNAFCDCSSSLTSVTIGNSVTAIGNYAFSNCTSLTSVTIPDSVTSIGGYAFYNCTSLTSITIPDSVTSIGERAFYHCTSLTSVTIPNSVTSIGEMAFSHCSSLTSVYCKPTTPPTGGKDMFSYHDSVCTIYVPRNSVAAYKSASYWSDYSSDIVGYDF